jgi:PA14 domain/Domain of unknown function (DUF4185)
MKKCLLLFSVAIMLSNWVTFAQIIDGRTDKPTAYPNTFGDSWVGTWADDDAVYVYADDTWNGNKSSNLAVYRLVGDDPFNLTVQPINSMDEYGHAGELGQDKCSWKASGITCVDGVLYIAVSRWDSKPSPVDMRQAAQNSSIIKSTDHGVTWSRSAKENYDNPMFPGRKFANPFFIEYGKDGKSNVDNADKYVYAVSTDGYWNNGSSLILGRVLRSKMGNLNGNDWEYYNGTGNEGLDIQNWTNDINKSKPVVIDSFQLGIPTITYNKILKRYILAQWNFPLGGWCGPKSRWTFRESPTPWGPWTVCYTDTFNREGWYIPCILSKFISNDGLDMKIIGSGDCRQLETYKLHVFPFTVCTAKSLCLSDKNLDFNIAKGSNETIESSIIVSNVYGKVGKLKLKDNPPWLKANIIDHGNEKQIKNEINTKGLEKGIYKARVKIIAENADPNDYDYSVVLNVFDPLPAKVISGVQNGLTYHYYESNALEGIPDFKNLEAIKTGISNNFDLSLKNRDTLFSMVFTGYININQTAVYSFIVKSDDGSRLFIDDSLVVDNDGQGSKFKSAIIGLEKGFHPIRMEYIQVRGGASLEMYYEAESIGIERTMISDNELYH